MVTPLRCTLTACLVPPTAAKLLSDGPVSACTAQSFNNGFKDGWRRYSFAKLVASSQSLWMVASDKANALFIQPVLDFLSPYRACSTHAVGT